MSPRPHADKPLDAAVRAVAACDFSRNLVVTAGAGTGKTSLLVERLLYLIIERGALMERIAAITFTVKAAAEMRDRLEEALERILSLASGEPPPGGGVQEADRVFERLEKGSRAAAAERAIDALETLDEASLGTIHSFAGEILRRHHRAAGVDPSLEVDEGNRARTLFDELWPRYVERELGSDFPPEGWKDVLGRISMDGLESIARQLATFRIPTDVLREDAGEVQRTHARMFATSRLEQVREIRQKVAGVSGINRNLLPFLEKLEAIFSRVAPEGNVPADLIPDTFPKSCTVGSRAEVDDPEAIQRMLDDLRRDARRLDGTDPEIVEFLARVLRPFVDEFRREYLARGFISYDALLLLTRDLLRDHPEVRRAEAARIDQLLVDEFQDTDPIQYEIIFLLAAADADGARSGGKDAYASRLAPGKLFIVGDAKQSIYHFRGADIRAYARAVSTVEREGGAVLSLQTNFRSVPEIVEPIGDLFETRFPAPGSIAAESFDPTWTPLSAHRSRAAESRIRIWSVGDFPLNAGPRRQAEATAIATRIRQWLDQGTHAAGDVAILLRALNTVLDTYVRPLRRLGIPYVVDGGKGFYQRYEVELLLAFLRASVSPADAISLVACLRSPVCAVPDSELQLYSREAHEQRLAPWSLDARPDPGSYPALARGLGLLRSLRQRYGAETLDRLARGILDETPLRLVMAASYEGAQRVANLEKAVRRIAELSRDGTLRDAEIISRLEEEKPEEGDEGDSPLADESVDAVRILSIHKAKGLEWPVVILPDLARGKDRPRGTDEVHVASGWSSASGSGPGGTPLPPALAMSSGGIRTPAYLHHHLDEERHEDAESLRLFYVATTRAREELHLLVGPPSRGRAPWVEALAAWGYVPEKASFPEAGSFHDGKVLHERVVASASLRAAAKKERVDPQLIRAARAFQEASARLASEERFCFRSPSSLGGEDRGEPALPEHPSESRGEHPERDIALAAGTAIHLLLEAWDGQSPEWLLDNARQAARVAAAGADLDPEPVTRKARAILERCRERGALETLTGLKPLARELPFLHLAEDGTVWDGTIDVVAGDPERPEVIDYKTSEGDSSAAELAKAYSGQLRRYAAALRDALGLPDAPPTRILPL